MNNWARLERLQYHMALANIAGVDGGRTGWTKYPKSHVQFNSIGGFLVSSEPSITIGPKHSNSSPTTKNTYEPTYSSKQDTEA